MKERHASSGDSDRRERAAIDGSEEAAAPARHEREGMKRERERVDMEGSDTPTIYTNIYIYIEILHLCNIVGIW